MADINYRVKLEAFANGLGAKRTSWVILDVSPILAESISVEYEGFDPTHSPGSFYVYKGTKARDWRLSDVKLVSRTSEEASRNQYFLNTLRGWTMSYFGLGTANTTTNTMYSSNALEYQKNAAKDTKKVPAKKQSSSTVTTTQTNKSTASGTGTVAAVTAATSTKNDKYQQTLQYWVNKFKAQGKTKFSPAMLGIATNPDTTDGRSTSTFLHGNGPSSLATDKSIQFNNDLKKAFSTSQQTIVQSTTVATTNPVVTTKPVTTVTTKPSVAPTDINDAKAVGKRWLGAPPDILYLTAYSTAQSMNGSLTVQTNVTQIPVVITSLNITWPNDVDYIPTTEGQPFPVVMTLDIGLIETHSPAQFNEFDIFKYRNGILPNF